MLPKIFSLGPFTLHTYGLMMALALLSGIYVAGRLAPRAGLAREMVWNLGVYMALAGLVGSKLLMIAGEWRYYSEHPTQIFSFSTLQAGGTFYGGLLLAIAVAVFYIRKQGASFAALADACSPGIALGLVLARLGCFSAGCCWGKPTEVAWGVTFANPYSAQIVGVPLGIALHPTQLYESALSLLIFGALLLLWRRRSFPGQIFAAFLLLYPAARFFLEFYRDDPRGPFFFESTVSSPQMLSVALFVVGVLYWWRQRRSSLSAQP